MKEFSYDSSTERKQHIGFSQYAYTILKEDYSIFNTDNKPHSWNGFLNKIIESYQDLKLYPANISHQFDTIYKDYYAALTSKFIRTQNRFSENQLRIITMYFRNAFINTHKANLNVSIPNKLSHTFNLSGYMAERVSSMENSLEDDIFVRPGKYFSAIFESYARKPFIEREQIILHEQINKIKNAIKKNTPIFFVHSNGKSYDFLPYILQPDKMGTYWYVAGMSIDQEGERYYSSFRVSRLLQIRDIPHKYAPLSDEEKMQLEKMISEKGIQFLVGHSTKAIIRFTQNGYKKYTNQLHRRPQISSKISTDTYEFIATLEQLEYYFFSFGNDAEILEPQELRDIFKQKYEQAAKLYTK